jgi:hypothetical protein
MGHRYRNRTAELEKLIKILRDLGIGRIEELTRLMVDVIQGYARQLQIEPLTKYEVEYVWMRLFDAPS